MELRDKILDYLHYHPASKRADIDAFVEEQASSATVKRMLSAFIDAGLVVSSGNNRATTYSITPKAHLLRTVDLDSYYAVDPDRRTVQKGYNFALIRDELPARASFQRNAGLFAIAREGCLSGLQRGS